MIRQMDTLREATGYEDLRLGKTETGRVAHLCGGNVMSAITMCGYSFLGRGQADEDQRVCSRCEGWARRALAARHVEQLMKAGERLAALWGETRGDADA